MNRKLILLITLTTLANFSTQGQETKQIKNENKDGDLEVFHVLKSDKNIKQGPYEKYFKYSNPMTRGKLLTERGQYDSNKKTGTWSFYWGENNMTSKGNYENDLKSGNWEFYKNGTVIEKGDYKNDRREGLWTYFEKDKGILEKGYYKEGKKIGKWTYHYYSVPVQTYDYTLDSVLQFFDDKGESEVVGSNNQMVKLVLSRPPQYVGHKRQLQTDMTSLTKYPIEARRIALEGKVLVSFTVNEDGTTGDFTIIRDIGGNCGQAVVEAFKSNPTKWVPGTYEGKKVKVKYYQSVSFSLTIDPISGLGQSEIVYE
jgi:hypothetical protein